VPGRPWPASHLFADQSLLLFPVPCLLVFLASLSADRLTVYPHTTSAGSRRADGPQAQSSLAAVPTLFACLSLCSVTMLGDVLSS
jgi:hypothetical protein